MKGAMICYANVVEKIENRSVLRETIIRSREERRKEIRNLAAQYEEQNQRKRYQSAFQTKSIQ